MAFQKPVTSALTAMNSEAAMNTSGVNGNPHTRTGRGRSGRRARSTSTAATVKTRKTHWTKTTNVKSCSKVPLIASTITQAPIARMATCGVRKRGWTRVAAEKKTPSSAIA